MSIPGTSAATIRQVIIGALDGQTLAGMTYLTAIRMTPSCDPLSLTSPSSAAQCVDGGFIVIPGAGRTVSGLTPRASNSTVQRMWEVPFVIRWSLDLNGVNQDRLSVDLLKIPAAVRRLVDAALEPPVGVNYNVVSISESTPSRQAGSILVFEVTYVIKFAFA